MLISFSGLDGAGKTTQIRMLLNAYQKLGAKVGSVYSYLPDIRYHSMKDLHMLLQKLDSFDVIHVRFRLNSDRNYAIMQRLESRMPPQPVMATAAAIQGYLDHKAFSKAVLEPLITKKKTLIFDRFYYDELAFKYVYGCPEFLLENIYKKEQDADLRFMVRISSDECVKRNLFRPDSNYAIYQVDTSITALVDRFDCIAERKKLIVLDGSQPIETVAQLVQNHISLFQEL